VTDDKERPLDSYRRHLRARGAYFHDLNDGSEAKQDSLGYFPGNYATELWWDESAECLRATAGIGKFVGRPNTRWIHVYNAALGAGHGKEEHIISPGSITMEGDDHMVASVDIPVSDDSERFNQLDAFGLVNRVIQNQTLRAARDWRVPFKPDDDPDW
jgi:hypothetical protein